MNTLSNLRERLQNSIKLVTGKPPVFFKTGAGQYSEHDQFMGISVPVLRRIAKDYYHLTLTDLAMLLQSSFNEERFLALVILIHQYQKADAMHKETVYQFYLTHLAQVNNWNLVDASAHLIIGAHLYPAEPQLLFNLAKSGILWERRIAIVATWYYIRNNHLEWTFKLASGLLKDPEDLMHKATGWMLREAGKKDEHQLIAFLNQHAEHMPRTMLRYAIEKFPESVRKDYLAVKFVG